MAPICLLFLIIFQSEQYGYLNIPLNFREYLEVSVLYSFRWQETTMPRKRGTTIYERICENYEEHETIYGIFTRYHINIHDSSMCKN